MHACQGDGELSGVALEIGSEVTATVSIIKTPGCAGPGRQTADRIMVMTTAMEFADARREAVEEMLTALENQLGLEPAEGLALISVAGDLRVGQAFGGMELTLRLEMPASLGLSPAGHRADQRRTGQVSMIVDVHSHLSWYPDHISEQFATEALASKLVKLRQSGGEAYAARLDLHSYDSRPEDHWAASATADRVVVFGIQARATGIWVPNELIAEYVAEHPEKLIGWCSVDPNEAGLRRAT